MLSENIPIISACFLASLIDELIVLVLGLYASKFTSWASILESLAPSEKELTSP
tara:strand:- start:905 stop:1066 length:162 start_codon:yes stop_codon:yes gene_type:complete